MARKKNRQSYEKRRKEQKRVLKQEDKRQRRFGKDFPGPEGGEYAYPEENRPETLEATAEIAPEEIEETTPEPDDNDGYVLGSY